MSNIDALLNDLDSELAEFIDEQKPAEATRTHEAPTAGEEVEYDVLDDYYGGSDEPQAVGSSAVIPETVNAGSTRVAPALPRSIPKQLPTPPLSVPTPPPQQPVRTPRSIQPQVSSSEEAAKLRMELERAKMELKDKEQFNEILKAQQQQQQRQPRMVVAQPQEFDEVALLREELERAKLELQQKHEISQVLMARQRSQQQQMFQPQQMPPQMYQQPMPYQQQMPQQMYQQQMQQQMYAQQMQQQMYQKGPNNMYTGAPLASPASSNWTPSIASKPDGDTGSIKSKNSGSSAGANSALLSMFGGGKQKSVSKSLKPNPSVKSGGGKDKVAAAIMKEFF